MTRSVWKGPFTDFKLKKAVDKALATGSKTKIRTWSRSSCILPSFINLTFDVHNGKRFVPVHVNERMIGDKLGEYAPTKFHRPYSGKKAVKVK